MKRLLLLTLLMSLSIGTFAQKTYIFIRAALVTDTWYNIYLSGNIPSNMSSGYNRAQIGEVFDLLSDNGYDLESTFAVGTVPYFIFSKKKDNIDNAIRSVKSEEDYDVYEVARYNLQGLPISEKEKGVQIVVYSNYTTKTIIKE